MEYLQYLARFRNVEPFYNGQSRVEGFDGSLSVIGESGETLVELRGPLRSPLEELSGDMVGMWRTQAIRAAVELGLFEALPASAQDIERALELADSVGVRLMRALTELGLVQPDAKGVYYHSTERGALLQRSHPLSLADAAPLWGGETYEAWTEAEYSLRTGRSAFRKLYGQNLFEHVKDRPEQLRSSHRAFATTPGTTISQWWQSATLESTTTSLTRAAGPANWPSLCFVPTPVLWPRSWTSRR